MRVNLLPVAAYLSVMRVSAIAIRRNFQKSSIIQNPG